MSREVQLERRWHKQKQCTKMIHNSIVVMVVVAVVSVQRMFEEVEKKKTNVKCKRRIDETNENIKEWNGEKKAQPNEIRFIKLHATIWSVWLYAIVESEQY